MSITYDPGGGAKTANFIPLSIPVIQGKEWDYIKDCLDSGWVSSVGEYVTRFENMMATQTQAAYAVATVNGTAALHLALLVAGVRPDDEVLVSTLTFIAPANAIRYVGAIPVFIDAEGDYWQIDPNAIAQFLDEKCERRNGETYNRQTGRRVRAIVPVHILGHSVDLDPILELARSYNLIVIEDASEAIGTIYKGKPVGNLGDLGCFSFNGNKLITSGGGGMITTQNLQYAEKARYLSTQAKDDPLEYIHGTVGYNYRLTNIQAALGCAQLEQLEIYLEKKRQIAAVYKEELSTLAGITPMPQADWTRHNFWLYTVLVDENRYGMSSRELLRALYADNIQTRPLWQPLHLSPAYSDLSTSPNPVAEKLYSQALSLPCSVNLSEDQQARVIEAIKSYAT